MEYKFCSPYELCFYDGIIYFILSMIGFSIISHIEMPRLGQIFHNEKYYLDHFNEFLKDFKNNNNNDQLIFVTEIFMFLAIYLIPLVIIKNYNVFNYLIYLIFNQVSIDSYYLAIDILYFLIVLFSCLVFNEFLEINCFGLQFYTKNNISKRAIEDSKKENIPLEPINDSDESGEYFLPCDNLRETSKSKS